MSGSILPEKVTLVEVGPRDGLQNEKNLVPTESKIAFIQSLKQAGVIEMELTSFVSPKWVPQMKDAEEIIHGCLDDQTNYVLVPNKKGVERFYASRADHIAVFVGVSDSFNQNNINRTTEESLQEWQPLIQNLKMDDKFIRACISTAFYCPYEGRIDPEATFQLCRRFADMGVDELSVADTVGMANPKDVYDVFSHLQKELGHQLSITGHFHNTRGTALANIYACLEAGVTRFDTSAGGLGGCPFAPGASGNVATEDVIFMLHEMGIDTGINMDSIIEAVNIVKPHITRQLDSKLYDLKQQASAQN
ncbi:hydroxymethylglutaryl-CoA lyase [Tuberibacillus sp. Marseille-P3662]|uniref:hydroxymethylglutaryl-CoA lyase n=1 Tax=Tuberibacillus sp. Marseille-P3662 TaxID=1965358 RepID=UPI000A1CA372|nr:hydroxymethylglutaryl-CoA lyase [Tuberibacillus sp. Marseille-P3662]